MIDDPNPKEWFLHLRLDIDALIFFLKALHLFSSQGYMKEHAWFHLFDQEYCSRLYMYNYEYVNYEDLTLIPVAWIPLPASWTAKAEG